MLYISNDFIRKLKKIYFIEDYYMRCEFKFKASRPFNQHQQAFSGANPVVNLTRISLNIIRVN